MGAQIQLVMPAVDFVGCAKFPIGVGTSDRVSSILEGVEIVQGPDFLRLSMIAIRI